MKRVPSLSVEEVGTLTPTVLRMSAPEGARVVALHWLYQIVAARADWNADGSSESLHRARVALRRLRATVKAQRAVLRGSRPVRLLDSMSRLQRATNGARDADASLDWLRVFSPTLSGDALLQASAMQERLTSMAEHRQGRVSSAFRRQFDSRVARFAERLSAVQIITRVGEPAPDSFALHLAQLLDESATTLLNDLQSIASTHEDLLPGALHHLRIQLKRERALLALHAEAHSAVKTWYTVAARGQTILGEMRDAAQLAAQATYDGANALAEVARGVAADRQQTFLSEWCSDLAELRRQQQQAANALRSAADTSVTPLPNAVAGTHPAPRSTTSTSIASIASLPTAMPMEYERKFLLTAIPPRAAAVKSTRIDQGWLPGTMLRERLRRAIAADGTERLTRTIKLGPATARIEVEEDTGAELFDALWSLTGAARIRKRRHVVPHGAHNWEIDVFLDRDLVLAEVELRHEHEQVTMPSWLAPYVVRDVSEESAYLNTVLARTSP